MTVMNMLHVTFDLLHLATQFMYNMCLQSCSKRNKLIKCEIFTLQDDDI